MLLVAAGQGSAVGGGVRDADDGGSSAGGGGGGNKLFKPLEIHHFDAFWGGSGAEVHGLLLQWQRECDPFIHLTKGRYTGQLLLKVACNKLIVAVHLFDVAATCCFKLGRLSNFRATFNKS